MLITGMVDTGGYVGLLITFAWAMEGVLALGMGWGLGMGQMVVGTDMGVTGVRTALNGTEPGGCCDG